MGRKNRPRPALKPPIPEQLAQAFKDFEGEGKKWGLNAETWGILEKEYPFPIRKNMTLLMALQKQFPKWWLLNLVPGCAFPAIPSLYELKAHMGPGQVITVSCKLIPPFDQLIDEEWDLWEKGVGRLADVLYVEYMRDAPKPDPVKVKQLRTQP